MEDVINKVLLDVFEGKIDINNYKEVKESFISQEETKREKTFDNLFEEFINTASANKLNSNDVFVPPDNFKDLVDIVSPILESQKELLY